MAEFITMKVNVDIKGPNGERLARGSFVTFPDSKYVRIMLKSGKVELVDPPSLDYIDKPEILNPAPAPKVEAPKPEPKVVEAVEVVKEEPKKAVKPSKTALFGAVEDKLKELEVVPETSSGDEADEASE